MTTQPRIDEPYLVPPVLFVLLGTSGKELGVLHGLYTQFKERNGEKAVGLLVADTAEHSVSDVDAGDAVPLVIPDIVHLRTSLDPYKESQHILRYHFPDYVYTTGGAGTNSSPQEGHVAAAAAYEDLCRMLMNKVIALGAHVPRSSREPTRVTILTLGFAGGGTFGGGLTVLLAAQQQVRKKVQSYIAVDRVLVATLPSRYEEEMEAKAGLALASLGGLAAIELTPGGVEVAGYRKNEASDGSGAGKGDRLVAPLFEAAYLFGTVPDQRGVDQDLARQQRYVVRAVSGLLDQRRPTSLGSAVLRWRRGLRSPRRQDAGGVPFQFSSVGVAEFVLERPAAVDLLSQIVLHQMYQALAEGDAGTQEHSPSPGSEPGDREFRRTRYSKGARIRERLQSGILVPTVPGSWDLVARAANWQGIAEKLEKVIADQHSTELEAQIAAAKREEDLFLTDQYGKRLGAGAVLSPAGYEQAQTAWNGALEPQRPTLNENYGKAELDEADRELKTELQHPWKSQWWPGPALLFLAGVLVSVVWLLVIPQLVFKEWIWAILSDSSLRSHLTFGQWVLTIFNPGFFFALAGLIAWGILSSPLFHPSRVSKPRTRLINAMDQRVRAYLAWAADYAGHTLDLYVHDQAQVRSADIRKKALDLRTAHATSARLQDSKEGYESTSLWLGAAVAGAHRAALSPLQGGEWTALVANKLDFGSGTPLEQGNAAWRAFAAYVLREKRVAEAEQADATVLHTIVSDWVKNQEVARAVREVANVLGAIQAGGADLGRKVSELLLEANPPLLLQQKSDSTNAVKERTKPFVELPAGASDDQRLVVQKVLGTEALLSNGDDPDRLLVLQVTSPNISYRMVANNGNALHEDILRQPQIILDTASCPQILEAMKKTQVLERVLGTYKAEPEKPKPESLVADPNFHASASQLGRRGRSRREPR